MKQVSEDIINAFHNGLYGSKAGISGTVGYQE